MTEEGALHGQVILIVGASSGLGLSAALACAAEGASLVLIDKEGPQVEQAALRCGSNARFLLGDACDPNTAQRGVELALKEFGGLNALYHVAGGSGRKLGDGPLHELTDNGLAMTLHWNLASVVYSNRAAVRCFLELGQGGCVLNMASVLAFSPSPRYFATHAYAAAKGGVLGLTKSAASYYAPHNIRFNALAPALVETPMSQRAAQDESILSFIRTKQPLDGGRIGRPEDLDAAVVMLLSPAARCITGQVIAVDSGWCVSEGQYEE